jgi:hypothetical protein
VIRLSTILYLLIPIHVLAQNLVPNPSFECGAEHCDFTEFGPDLAEHICSWNCPTGGTSDVFSTLLTDKKCWASMPYNTAQRDPTRPHIGTQRPRTGSRFAGIHPFSLRRCYREYLQVKLTTPLIPGEEYCAEMYVSSASRVELASNNLGMSFYDEEVVSNDLFYYCILDKTPQVVNTSIITDTINWIRVSGTFVATSAAQYLSIGNFASEDQTQYIRKPGPYPDFDRLSYYFIDDVSVQHLSARQFTFSGNTTICEGERATIEALGGLSDLKWTTLNDTLTILSQTEWLIVSPQQTTTYRATGKNCSKGVKATVTIHVNPSPQVNIGKDATLCLGENLLLDAGAGHMEYQWNDNSHEQYLTVNQTGSYAITVKNAFDCSASDEINIFAQTIPQVDLGNDTLICHNFFPLNAGVRNASAYQWSSGSTDSVYLPKTPGRYWVTVENECGHSTDTITVRSLFVPNVITVNADGRNEKFQLATIEDHSGKLNTDITPIGALDIFDRSGSLIFTADKYKNDWPKENDDVYSGVYYFTYQHGACDIYKGWVNIIK